jgi:outer membrane biosynthesis protein TonB
MPSRAFEARISFAVFALAVSFSQAGCLFHSKVHAAAPVATAPQPEAQRPMTVAPDTDASPPKPPEEPAPAVPAATPAPSLAAIAKPKVPPAPPKPTTEQPAASEPAADSASHAPVPQISPQLSPADQQNYERKMNDDISAAEKGLQQTNNRQLNAYQQDLVEKIRSFLDQSRDAGKSGDWVRAQNLAQKARLLSNDLVNSL